QEELREIAPELFAGREGLPHRGAPDVSGEGGESAALSDADNAPSEVCPVEMDLQAVERRHVVNVLERAGGNRDEAARLLGISRTTLWRRMKKLGVEG